LISIRKIAITAVHNDLKHGGGRQGISSGMPRFVEDVIPYNPVVKKKMVMNREKRNQAVEIPD